VGENLVKRGGRSGRREGAEGGREGGEGRREGGRERGMGTYAEAGLDLLCDQGAGGSHEDDSA